MVEPKKQSTFAAIINERIKLDVLDDEKRAQAQRFIDEERPLKDTPIQDVLPTLRKCCCKLKLPAFIPNAEEEEKDEG